MLRFFAAILITVSGGGIGAIRSDKLRTDRDISRQTSELIRQFIFAVKGRSADFYELIEILRNSRRFTALRFASGLPSDFDPQKDIRHIWRSTIISQKNLPLDPRDILLEIGDSFGSFDSDGVIRSLEALLDRSRLVEKTAQERLEKCGKLYRSLGLLFGAMAAVLII